MRHKHRSVRTLKEYFQRLAFILKIIPAKIVLRNNVDIK